MQIPLTALVRLLKLTKNLKGYGVSVTCKDGYLYTLFDGTYSSTVLGTVALETDALAEVAITLPGALLSDLKKLTLKAADATTLTYEQGQLWLGKESLPYEITALPAPPGLEQIPSGYALTLGVLTALRKSLYPSHTLFKPFSNTDDEYAKRCIAATDGDTLSCTVLTLPELGIDTLTGPYLDLGPLIDLTGDGALVQGQLIPSGGMYLMFTKSKVMYSMVTMPKGTTVEQLPFDIIDSFDANALPYGVDDAKDLLSDRDFTYLKSQGNHPCYIHNNVVGMDTDTLSFYTTTYEVITNGKPSNPA